MFPMPAMNLSEEESDASSGSSGSSAQLWNVTLASYYVLIFLIAVPGNGLALWAFWRQSSSSPTRVFLSSLSAADLCYVFILPMRVGYHLMDRRWPFGDVLCRLSGFLFYLNMYCSLYLMSFISLDRFLAVALPVKSQTVRKPKYAKVAVGILWATVIVSMSPTLSLRKGRTATPGSCRDLYLEKTSSSALVSTVVAFTIPLAVIMVFYTLILLKLRTLDQHEHRPVRDKAIKMIVLVMLNFLLAFVPYHVCRVVYIRLTAPGPGPPEPLLRANQITSALTCVSGVLDPVMYFFLNRAYRNQLLHLFCRRQEATL